MEDSVWENGGAHGISTGKKKKRVFLLQKGLPFQHQSIIIHQQIAISMTFISKGLLSWHKQTWEKPCIPEEAHAFPNSNIIEDIIKHKQQGAKPRLKHPRFECYSKLSN